MNQVLLFILRKTVLANDQKKQNTLLLFHCTVIQFNSAYSFSEIDTRHFIRVPLHRFILNISIRGHLSVSGGTLGGTDLLPDLLCVIHPS
jgi:hypothetical protein